MPNLNDELKRAIEALNIDKPIMSTQLTDNRLKIYLLGGDSHEWEIIDDEEEAEPSHAQQLADSDVIANPKMYDRAQLRPVAARLGIEGAMEMNKRPLVKAINRWKRENG